MVKSVMKAPLYPADYEERSEPYGYLMTFESGIKAFNFDEYELPDDKRIKSIPLYTTPQTKPSSVKDLSDLIYEFLCNDALYPPKGQHWEEFIADEIARAIEAKVRCQL